MRFLYVFLYECALFYGGNKGRKHGAADNTSVITLNTGTNTVTVEVENETAQKECITTVMKA